MLLAKMVLNDLQEWWPIYAWDSLELEVHLFIYIVSQNTVLTTSEFDILEKVYVSAKTRCHRETVYTVSPLDNNEFNNNSIIITFEK